MAKTSSVQKNKYREKLSAAHAKKRATLKAVVMDRETRVEIAPWAAARFAGVVARPDPGGEDDHIRIEPLAPMRGPRR